jgi:hypothetical protein
MLSNAKHLITQVYCIKHFTAFSGGVPWTDDNETTMITPKP